LDLNELKKGGLLKQKQKDYFILRTRIPGGYLKADALEKFRYIAKKYGRGYIHLSVRQCIEVAWIHLKDLEKVKKKLGKVGISTGACGPRSRNVVACPGSSVCRFGFTDTEALSKKLDKEFFGRDVPKKFKIGISGCLNSCSKPQENDIGFMAVGYLECDLKICTGCTLCANVCEKVCARAEAPLYPNEYKRAQAKPAIVMDENKKPVYKKELCFFEGDCVRVCPVDAWKVNRVGYTVFLGGKVGRFPMLGYKIAEFVTEEDIFTITEKAIACYNRIAEKGQRFGEAINKVGIEEVKKQILWTK
ncbi:MAG: nitrite reductase, partial [Candidatus Omnitrophota bacterium]